MVVIPYRVKLVMLILVLRVSLVCMLAGDLNPPPYKRLEDLVIPNRQRHGGQCGL